MVLWPKVFWPMVSNLIEIRHVVRLITLKDRRVDRHNLPVKRLFYTVCDRTHEKFFFLFPPPTFQNRSWKGLILSLGLNKWRNQTWQFDTLSDPKGRDPVARGQCIPDGRTDEGECSTFRLQLIYFYPALSSIWTIRSSVSGPGSQHLISSDDDSMAYFI